MPEQENTTTSSPAVETPSAPTAESAIVDAPDTTEASPESTPPASKPIPSDVPINADVNAFEALSGVNLNPSSSKSTDISSKLPLPEKPKLEIPKAKDDDKKLESPVPDKPSFKTRDFSGLSPEEINVAKRMSEGSSVEYRKVVLENRKIKEELTVKEKLVKDLQEGKEILPPNYYENPDAVIFSPSYRSTAKNTEVASLVVNHWETQLMRVKNGQEWTDLDNDPKTGELMLGQNKPSTVEDEVKILSYLSGAQNQLNNYKNKLTTITSNFKSENSKILSTIKETEKKFFPQYEEATPQVTQVGEEIKKLGISESNPIFGLMSKSGALNIQLSELLQNKEKEIVDLKSKLGIKDSIKKDAMRAGPSSSSLSSPGATNGESTSIPSYDEFKNRLLP